MRIGHASHRQHSGRSSRKEEDVASLDSRTGLVARITAFSCGEGLRCA
jgi:hypothetical protein